MPVTGILIAVIIIGWIIRSVMGVRRLRNDRWSDERFPEPETPMGRSNPGRRQNT